MLECRETCFKYLLWEMRKRKKTSYLFLLSLTYFNRLGIGRTTSIMTESAVPRKASMTRNRKKKKDVVCVA